MGRPAKSWTISWKRGYAYVRFTWEGVPYYKALGTQDEGEAAQAAARIYADVVHGRIAPTLQRPGELLDLVDLWSQFLDWKRPTIHPQTAETLLTYGNRFVQTFRSLENITKATGANYGMARLGEVKRTSVLKELCFLRQFLRWCNEQGSLAVLPEIPRLPPKSKGIQAGPQRAKAIDVTEEELRQILEALPVESKTIDGRRWPIRDHFAFAFETSLRPETMFLLEAPKHWRPGLRTLEIRDEDDKARFGRTVDLTPEAVAILRRVHRGDGLLFGRHCFTKALKEAASKVLGARRAKHFAPYDFRHGRARALLDAGASLRGVAYVLGHKRLTTTDRYVAPDRRAGQEALRAARTPV